MRKVYLDLDGVFADFDGKCKTIFGKYPKEMDSGEFWKLVCGVPHFWADLKVLPESRNLLRILDSNPNIHVEFLTALPRGTGECSTCKEDKIQWVHKNLGDKYTVNTVIGGINKARFVKSPTDILIDDMQKNIDAWNVQRWYWYNS